MVLQLENTNIDAILDLGLSRFEHREKFREIALKNNIEIKLHFLDIPKVKPKQRVFERNKSKGVTYEFEVTEENFGFIEGWFEKLTKSELKNAIIMS